MKILSRSGSDSGVECWPLPAASSSLSVSWLPL